jgi:hypothetical protein
MPAKPPLVAAYGLGVDSTAMLIGLAQHGIRPDLVLFADVGGEKPETYLYASIMRQWLRDTDFPQFEVVRYRPPLAPYDTLFGNCWQNETLPSLAFGRKSCSIKWKREPQDRRVRQWLPALEAWDSGLRVRKLIGFDACEERRRYGDQGGDPQYEYRYPLMEWGWDRTECQRVIAAEGLPVPVKSACYFCPASKKPELVELSRQSPDLYQSALALEDRYRGGKHFRGERAGTKGLGRTFAWRDHGRRPGFCLPPSSTQPTRRFAHAPENHGGPEQENRPARLWKPGRQLQRGVRAGQHAASAGPGSVSPAGAECLRRLCASRQ